MAKVINGIQVPQRADFVGSFLRPENLSENTRDQLVKELTDKQKELGYHVITDGEFNRTFWHLDFFWGFGGVAHEPGGDVTFNGETARLDKVYLTGKLTAKPHPFIEAFKRVKKFEDAQKAVEDAGYPVITVDTSEFRKIDGGLSCLSLRF